MQASGGRQAVLEGRPAKAIYAAYSNHVGALSAQLSAAGLACDCDVFEGEAGLFKTYYHGQYHRSALDSGWGETWAMLDVGFKPWPTTGVAHPFIEAALQLAREYSIDPTTIVDIHIRGGSHARTFCEPEEKRKRPSSPVEGEDSVFFSVGKALANGNVTLRDLQPTGDGLRQPEALALTAKMHLTVEEELNRSGIVEVTLASGQTVSRRIDAAPGHPSNPLPQDRLVGKFMDCAGMAAVAIKRESLDQVVEMIDRLETVDDVSRIPELLGGA
jgi:2-methylcitrate dehydratase PrpD